MGGSKADKQPFATSFPATMYAKSPPLDEDTKKANREADELVFLRSTIVGAIPILKMIRDRIARSTELSDKQKAIVFAVIDGLVDEGCA